MLKKYILLLFSLGMLLSLASCTQTPELPYLTEETATTNETKNVIPYTYTPDIEDSATDILYSAMLTLDDVPSAYDGELYFQSMDMLFKLNKETGKMNEMCKDPVCKHDTKECPFYGRHWNFGFHIYDNKVIYMRGFEKAELRGDPFRLLIYDIEKGSFKVFHEYDKNASGYVIDHTFHGGEIFFHDRIYNKEYDSDKSVSQYNLTLMKVDLSTLEKEEIYTSDYKKINVLCGDENNIYYLDMLEKKICVAKERDFSNSSVLIDDHGGHFFVVEDRVFYVSSKTGNLTSKKLDGTDEKDLGISNIYRMYITDKYIYYRQKKDFDIVAAPVSPDKKEQRVTLPLANEIYRCTHDGENVEVVYKAYDGEPLEMGDVVYYLTSLYVFEGYLYTTFTEFSLKEDGTIGDDASTNSRGPFSYMRVNCNTGEVYIIEMPEI